MDTMLDMLSRGVEQLLGRAGGPLHFRLFVMPLVVSFLAVRAHQRDVREGRSVSLGALLTDSAERRRLFRSGLKDFGKVFIVACVLDAAYQILVLRSFYLGELLIVAVACAVVPYCLIRGPVTRLATLLYRKWVRPAAPSAVSPNEDTRGRPDHGLTP